jgi:hypothetical protein
MTIDELVARVEKKLPPAPEGQLRELEAALGWKANRERVRASGPGRPAG